MTAQITLFIPGEGIRFYKTAHEADVGETGSLCFYTDEKKTTLIITNLPFLLEENREARFK